MFFGRIKLFRIFGIPLYVDFSWLIIAALVTWTLADRIFPYSILNQSQTTYWILGAVTALAFFASIVLHELGHALSAIRFGMPIRGITLFIFGGVAELGGEMKSALSEFVVAIAGPLVSLAIAVLAGVAWYYIPTAHLASEPLRWLMNINIALVIFNMVPAFPLDGGRVLRSILWAIKKDLVWATKITCYMGVGFGFLLFALAILAFYYNDVVQAVWLFLIGMFVKNAAKRSYQQVLRAQTMQDRLDLQRENRGFVQPDSRYIDHPPIIDQPVESDSPR